LHDPLNRERRPDVRVCFTERVDRLVEIRERIARLAADSRRPLTIQGITVFRAPRATEPLGSVTAPVFALVAQGGKRSLLGDRVFAYEAGQYLITTVDLPLTSHIVTATPTEPFLGFGLALEPASIAQLLVEATPAAVRDHPGPAIATSDADEALLDAVVRLLRLVDSPRDFEVLAPAVRREIHWRLLNGPQAALVRQIGLADGRLALIARAIEWIKSHYDQAIRIDELAGAVNVSVSSLNRHFRTVTSMSPLQFQKQLRLQQARIRLIAAPHDVAAVGYAVGYDSPSQFSREYRRMFGAPPGQDATRLQSMALGG
jgi:AraC-like DNA-binding protein